MLSVASVVQVSRAAINHQIYLISTQSFISYHPLILCEDPSSTQIHSILAGRKETRILQTIVCSLYSSVEGVGVYEGEEDKTLHVVVYAQAHHISLPTSWILLVLLRNLIDIVQMLETRTNLVLQEQDHPPAHHVLPSLPLLTHSPWRTTHMLKLRNSSINQTCLTRYYTRDEERYQHHLLELWWPPPFVLVPDKFDSALRHNTWFRGRRSRWLGGGQHKELV